MKSITIPVVFVVLFMSSVEFKFSDAVCGTCAAGDGECVDTTCWCVADKGGDDCATDCVGGCTDQVCAGTGTSPSCVACPVPACSANGACASKAGDAASYCRCTAGWTGATCETKKCDVTDVCENGGTCGADDICACVPGYTGDLCATDTDECLSDPCQNDGTCTDDVNGYTCACPTDYTGVHCENMDECLSDPCQNNGTCTDDVNGYTCTCPTDYTGVHCESESSGASKMTTALPLMLAALLIFKLIN